MIMFKIIVTIIALVILIPLLILLWYGLKAWAMVFICLWQGTWWSAESRANHYDNLRREIENRKYYR